MVINSINNINNNYKYLSFGENQRIKKIKK